MLTLFHDSLQIPAILYLPHGFATSGYTVALPMLIITTAVFLYSSSCLLQTWKNESTKSNNDGEGTALLPENTRRVAARQMLSYPELAYRALGERGESIVKTGIALMQSGVCLTYLIFVPQNLHTSFFLLTGVDISPNIWLGVMIAIEIPLSWIRDIRKLTPTNLLANGLILFGLLTCIYFALGITTDGDKGGPMRNLADHISELKPFADDWFLFIGTSVSSTCEVQFRTLRGSQKGKVCSYSQALNNLASIDTRRCCSLKAPLHFWCPCRRLSFWKKNANNSHRSTNASSCLLLDFICSLVS